MLHIDFLSPMKGLTSFLILGMKNGVEYDVYLIHGQIIVLRILIFCCREASDRSRELLCFIVLLSWFLF